MRNDAEWFKHFFDDLGAVAMIGDRERRQEAQFANQHKLARQKHKFTRGQPKAAEPESYALTKLRSSALENQQAVAA